ncbi:MAG: PEGA domain-containing protein [Elusimicrobiota bacterium]
MINLRFLIIFMLIVTQTGCATVFKGSSQKVTVNSDPSGARVYINNFYTGDTPLQTKLKLNKTYNIEIKKEGYEDSFMHMSSSIGAGWLTLDLIFSIVLAIPLVVDGITSSWNHFDQTEINAPLEKADKSK